MPEIDGVKYSFTQPICKPCFKQRYPNRIPSALIDPEREICADCGEETRAGIYFRHDPRELNYPTPEEEL